MIKLNVRTSTGRASRTKILHRVCIALQAANVSASMLQVLGMTPATALTIATVVAVFQSLAGDYLRDQTSEPMA